MDPPKKKARKTVKGKKKQESVMKYLVDASTTVKPETIERNWQDEFFSGVKVRFPFVPYPSQRQLMANVIRTLKNKENALLESPTGSGKTLVLLCAALAWRETEKERQIKEFNDEIAKQRQEDELERKELEKPIVIDLSSDEEEEMVEEVVEIPSDDDFEAQNIHLADASKKNRKLVEKRANKAKKRQQLEEKEQAFREKRLQELDYREKARSSATLKLDLPTIYYASRTTKQVAQLVAELKKNCSYRPKMAVLASRSNMCVNSKVIGKKSDEGINERCKTAVENHDCAYRTRSDYLVNHNSLKRGGEHEVWDIEDLVAMGKKHKSCSYYASRDIAAKADLVFLPYNFILDKSVRDASGIKLKDNVVILDEAHNVESVCQEAASFVIREDELAILLQDLSERVNNTQGIVVSTQDEEVEVQRDYQVIQQVISQLLQGVTKNLGLNSWQSTNFEKSVSQFGGQTILRYLEEACKLTEPTYRTFSDAVKRINDATASERAKEDAETTMETLTNNSTRILSALDMVLNNIFNHNYISDYRMALVLRRSGARGPRQVTLEHQIVGNPDKSLEFWCLNPAVAFSDLVSTEEKSGCRSIILASGTLSPLDSFQSELGAPFKNRVEATHVIKSDQIFCGALGHAPLHRRDREKGMVRGNDMMAVFKNCDTFAWQDDLGQALLDIMPDIPGGILVFLPSYSLMDKIISRWQSTKMYNRMTELKHVFQEPRSGKDDVDELMSRYRFACKGEAPKVAKDVSGAVMFAIYRGKMSEGIDFADEMCRCVVAVGIPFPHSRDLAIVEKKNYNSRNSSRGLLNGADWYEIQAFRALNQALGRCIRHRNDWGAVLLYDVRFLQDKYLGKISKWLRRVVVKYPSFENAHANLKQFMDTDHTIKPEVPRIQPVVEMEQTSLNDVDKSLDKSIFKENSMVDNVTVKTVEQVKHEPVEKQVKPEPMDVDEKENIPKPRVNLEMFRFKPSSTTPSTSKPSTPVMSKPSTPVMSKPSTPMESPLNLPPTIPSPAVIGASSPLVLPTTPPIPSSPVFETPEQAMMQLPLLQPTLTATLNCPGCKETLSKWSELSLIAENAPKCMGQVLTVSNPPSLAPFVETIPSTTVQDYQTPVILREWSVQDCCFVTKLFAKCCKQLIGYETDYINNTKTWLLPEAIRQPESTGTKRRLNLYDV